MRNWLCQLLIGTDAREVESLRSQVNALEARNQALIDERDDLRQELRESRAAEVLALQKMIDAERLDSNRALAFGVGPKPAEQPPLDFSKLSGGRASRAAERHNREFIQKYPIHPNSGWDPIPEEAPPENLEQAS